ncbi:hypothetical protein TK1368 [Thermococcus kodakarensis KOD1]|uniref:Uncharacterized protein n=1 Tax=Thermococcus kodakarensis (strain ATCC BAA-918 / JCM 12380 / KOD1) TaxID=69014 RepID=Q5JGY7_THEKO|nr:hypothetical protein [Thermococcus kodakarensis]WCN27347.1 hypothetical protein POG15_06950 [Thermococcus kodakarensis]WCN29636.1 hypothetical protein POG21_06945 [Thermococcus kodakarensis]BAD85557.1 hypothetical protein TK1368 [Thermococcus kodakarensis KOD1]
MSRRGRKPVLKAWLVRIHGRENREIIIQAKTREEAERTARFIVKQSFPFSSYSLKNLGRVRE